MADNQPWNLESFIESLIYELDRTQDMLSLKGFDQRITYTVEDMALDLQLFPTYTGDKVLFATARPGEVGASKVSLKLGSITDRQIRESARPPVRQGDVAVEAMKDLDDDTKKTLSRMGVRSVKDLETMDQRRIDLGRASGNRLDYAKLAGQIAKAKRSASRPQVKDLHLSRTETNLVVSMTGRNFVLDGSDPEPGFPVALVNHEPADVVFASPDEIHLSLLGHELRPGDNKVAIALDPYSVIQMNVKA
jgi:hypothetical protein